MRAFSTILALVLVTVLAPLPAFAERGADAALSIATDLNPDPRVVEIELAAYEAEVEIAPGRRVKTWTYDGTLPGPLIRAGVGDRLIIHFTNRLPAPTTLHWHGLRVPIQMDGVPDHSQPDVKPGESFTYDFVLPDAGLFWYHPHVMSAAQVGFGLYGALLIDGPDEGFTVPDERVFVLSDIDLTARDVLEPPDTGGSAGMAFGREGNVLLVNGRNHPRINVPANTLQRWRVVNAAKSRYFKLDPGEGQRLTKIGGDGGLQEYPVTHDMIVLAPGERADLLFVPVGAAGTTLSMIAQLADRGYGSVETRSSEELFEVNLTEGPRDRPALPQTARAIPIVDQTGATPVAIEFGIGQTREGEFEYLMNGKPLGRFPAVKARVGETQVWTITNTTAWSHPFHLHGFFFQVLDKNGVAVRPAEWKDTVSVPYKDKLSVVVRYDDRPGMWMFHCHVLDHADGGLMGMVELTAGDGSQPAHTHSDGR